jgi:hypothetical protein
MTTLAWKYQHTLSLSTLDCANLGSLTTSQREELQSALEALKRHNDKIEPVPQFPPDFRAKVAAYAEAMIAQKVAQRSVPRSSQS